MQRTYFYKIITLFLCLLGASIIYFFTKLHGVGISPDSVFYISVADNLLTNGRLTDFNHKAFIDFPAGYPVFISIFNFITHLQPQVWVSWMNMLLFALLILLAATIFQKTKQANNIILIVLLSLIITSPALLEIYSMLWSETVFLVLVLLFILQLNRYNSKPTNANFLLLIIVAMLAAICRYAGICLIGYGAIFFLIQQGNTKQKIKSIILFVAFASSLLLINLLRNQFVSTTITGLRKPATENIGQHLARYAAVIIEWFGFSTEQQGWLMVLGVLFFILLFVVLIYYFKKNFLLATLAGFTICYSAFMLITSSITKYEHINNRLLSPIIICVYIIIIMLISEVLQKNNKAVRAFIINVCLTLLINIQYKNLRTNYETWDGVKDAGVPGYTEQMWDDMQVVQWLKQNKQLLAQKTLFANANDAVYFFTKLPCTQLPQKEFNFQISKFLAAPTGYLIWLNEGDNPELIPRNFILQNKKMVLVQEFDEGAVYSW